MGIAAYKTKLDIEDKILHINDTILYRLRAHGVFPQQNYLRGISSADHSSNL